MESCSLSHLEELEAESIHLLRETASQFQNTTLLFSGGKDSLVCLHLIAKAFYPANSPFVAMHVDTGHTSRCCWIFATKFSWTTMLS